MQKIQYLANEILLSIGSAAGLTAFLTAADMVLTVILQLVSIISFSMVIMINWSRWVKKVKRLFK